ncbi:MAG TPA: S1 family peptidase [Mycobacteriales bacterium]|nr:S1 family peptidase [Mycobacteriales bacterium]
MAVAGVFVVAVPSAQAAPVRAPELVAPADPAALSGALAHRLGARSAGSYFDRASGKLVVTVTDSSAAEIVRGAGAVPRQVARSGADLARATATLDRSARIPGTSWAVDPASNQVVVSASTSVKGADLAKLRSVVTSLGAAARLRYLDGQMTATATVMKNGTAIFSGSHRCSLGFSVQPIGNTDPNLHYFLTAGHCVAAGSTWYARNGDTSLLGSNSGPGVFGAGGDYGFVHYTGAGIRVLSQIEGRSNVITRTDDPYIGEGVARSGSTSGVHNGTVTALNVTMTYERSRTTVTGLIETNVCAEPGDSGGPLYALDKGLGITSGGLGNCLGGTQISWYQPVAPLMANYFMQIWP